MDNLSQTYRECQVLSQSKLDLLNSIVWPEIWRLVEVKVHEAGSHGYTVCVIDAAVLVLAGWHRRVHQIWTTLCPHSEVCMCLLSLYSYS